MKEEEYSGISIKQDSQKSSFNPIDIMRIEKDCMIPFRQ